MISRLSFTAVILASFLLPLTAQTQEAALSEAPYTNLVQWDEGYKVAQRRKISSRRTKSKKIQRALRQLRSNNYQGASKNLFKLSVDSRYKKERARVKYLLGLTFYKMGLNQAAAFQFVEVIKMGKSPYTRRSLQKLSVAADALGNSNLLNYAISKMKLSSFSREHKDMLNFRVGEYKLGAKDYSKAAKYFSRVRARSPLYFRAKYFEGLANAEQGKTKKAIRAFDRMLRKRKQRGVTDNIRVLALLSKARIYYQQKKWDQAIAVYRKVPKDTYQWHEALFESTWAMLRSARFRSALSNLHSLHSTYYDNYYQPESLLLRAIVYLYICRYDEMEKVLAQFEKTYTPLRKKISNFLKYSKNSSAYLKEIENVYFAKTKQAKRTGELPYMLGAKILQELDVQKELQYLAKIKEERKKYLIQPYSWKNSPVGSYVKKVLQIRIKNTQKTLNKLIRRHTVQYAKEIRNFQEQVGFIRYEMINGRKNALKKRIAGRAIDLSIEEDKNRDFYVQNGYEFWPFQGEYWLDEIGNYHYIGKQNCE